jgi:hypothetical protein
MKACKIESRTEKECWNTELNHKRFSLTPGHCVCRLTRYRLTLPRNSVCELQTRAHRETR